jgi:hypothetical protein
VACLDGSNLGFLLRNALGKDGVVLCLLLLLGIESPALDGAEVTLALETLGCNETLDFGTLHNQMSAYHFHKNKFEHDVTHALV